MKSLYPSVGASLAWCGPEALVHGWDSAVAVAILLSSALQLQSWASNSLNSPGSSCILRLFPSVIFWSSEKLQVALSEWSSPLASKCRNLTSLFLILSQAGILPQLGTGHVLLSARFAPWGSTQSLYSSDGRISHWVEIRERFKPGNYTCLPSTGLQGERAHSDRNSVTFAKSALYGCSARSRLMPWFIISCDSTFSYL